MRILIVEDEPKTGKYLKKGLAEAGFVVDWVSIGSMRQTDKVTPQARHLVCELRGTWHENGAGCDETGSRMPPFG